MNKDIFGLQVPVDNVVIVHEVNGVRDLLRDVLDFFLWKVRLVIEVGKKIAPWAELKHQIKVLLVVEKAIQLGYVGVVQKALYFDLPDQLINIFCHSLEDGLSDFLEGANKVGCLVPC